MDERGNLAEDEEAGTESALRPSRNRSDQQRVDNIAISFGKAQHSSFSARADSDTLPSPIASPVPVSNAVSSELRRPSDAKPKRRSRSALGLQLDGAETVTEAITPESWLRLYHLHAHSPVLPPPLQAPQTTEQSRRSNREHTNLPSSRGSRGQQSRRLSLRSGRGTPGVASASQLDITALPSMSGVKDNDFAQFIRTKPTPQAQRASRIATELYIISYLIFFAIWGTLARLGLQALTFYPGAPVIFSELWANVAGTFVMGLLAEDWRIFRSEWGAGGGDWPEPKDEPAGSDLLHAKRAKARHVKTKKTIPLYIGLATGFCGSFTSFSSFIRDVFLSLSNDLRSPVDHPYPPNAPIPSPSTTIPRNGGDSFMAICAAIIITVSACYCALKAGAHVALLLDPIMPTLPFRIMRRFLDPLVVFLGWGMWLGAVLLCIFPPHIAWRGQALFACAFAPVGCFVRYYVSLHANPISPSFPLGTLAVNLSGTAILGMAWDLQHVPLRGTGVAGGSVVSCQILQGIMDGFCGTLTTVSTWILEVDSLKRRQAYIYGSVSVAAGLALLVVIMGSVRWTVGWQEIIC